ncbi:MAG: TenA family protein [Rhizobiaceae bacterium]
MKASNQLKDMVSEDWLAATRHPFTNALADGSLDIEKMQGYLQQDYLFIDGFVRLLASAIAHAPHLADSVPAAQFLAVITGPENTYFLRSFEALDCQPDAVPQRETLAFQNLMHQARKSGKYEQMLAVLCVAEWVYLEWATPFSDRADDLPFWFGEWVTLHCGEGFEDVVAYLRGQLDQVCETLDAKAWSDVVSLFSEAVRLERAFFDAAWTGFPVAGRLTS